MATRGRRGSDEHREYEDMAVAHVVGGLTLDQGRLFRSHLLECTACRARVGELRAIAHDLADVERDERRQRAAQRTELKEREDDDTEVVAPSRPWQRWRMALVAVVVLGGLVALSSWNFVLRSQLERAREQVTQQRDAVNVLQNGTRWLVQAPSDDGLGQASDVDGQVSTLDDELVVMVDGLTEDTYAMYLLDAEGGRVDSRQVEATEGMVFAYLSTPRVPEAAELLLVRSDDLMPDPRGAGPTVFAAEHPPPGQQAPLDAAVDPQVETVGASGR